MKIKNVMKKMLAAAAAFVACLLISVVPAKAQAGDQITLNELASWNIVIGTYDANGNIVFHPQTADYRGKPYAKLNALALTQLCSGDQPKTIIIPSGSDVKISFVVNVGNNTTIIADGARITQTEDGKGILSNLVDSAGYDAVSNVRIQGGTWTNAVNQAREVTTLRFAMGSNIQITNATVDTNYYGHAVELIACQNVTVSNCTLTAKGVPSKDSAEEALQIDVATPKTAPGVVKEGAGRFLQGQTCRNITVQNNTISGSRGVCANFATHEKKYQKNSFHENVVIQNNRLTGSSSEACALFNTLNAKVLNNTIVTNSTQLDEAYSVGLNIMIMGKSPAVGNSTVIVKGNTIKGGRQGMQIASKTKSPKSRYKSATVKNNKTWSSAGKDQALVVYDSAVKKINLKGNKMKAWK